MPDLAALYKHRFREADLPEKNRIWKTLCKHYFQRRVGKNATVLDLACGYGEFINNISAARKIGVDLNTDVTRFLGKDVEFHSIPATDLSSLGKNVADVAFTSNFLEHLRDKEELDEVFRQILSVLKPGGKFIVMGPNIKYLAGAYWDFYDHYLPLSHLSLEEGLTQGGFKVTEVIDRFLPYTTRSNLPKSSALIAGYVRFPVAWPWLGKQFLVTAVKPN